MQLPQRALKTLNLALVINLLPLRQLQCFQHFLHFIERMLQFLDDSIHLIDGIGDGWGLMRGFRLLAWLARFPQLAWFPQLTRFAWLTWFPLLGFLDRGWG